jgi:hypothetical protein
VLEQGQGQEQGHDPGLTGAELIVLYRG